MTTTTSIDIPVKPRVLIADDSRIVRATLIKHIEGMFEFREALDGEQAWETLLLDPNIRVVITDLTMPKLDGYGLLQRIRSSKVSRIRNIPVVVVSGSDEQEERDRAKAAGATDLITKGIGTAQLLSRLDILSKLVATQDEFERSLETLLQAGSGDFAVSLASFDVFREQAETLFAAAAKGKKNFVVLNVRIGLKHVRLEGGAADPPAGVVNAIGQLLQRTVRHTDCVAKTGEAEFMLATGSINPDAARFFAQRVCRAITCAHLINNEDISFIASCGLDALCDHAADGSGMTLESMCETARSRGQQGMDRAITGVIGASEERVLQEGKQDTVALSLDEDDMVTASAEQSSNADVPDLITLVRWIKEGKQDQVMLHLENLSPRQRPLVDLALERSRR